MRSFNLNKSFFVFTKQIVLWNGNKNHVKYIDAQVNNRERWLLRHNLFLEILCVSECSTWYHHWTMNMTHWSDILDVPKCLDDNVTTAPLRSYLAMQITYRIHYFIHLSKARRFCYALFARTMITLLRWLRLCFSKGFLLGFFSTPFKNFAHAHIWIIVIDRKSKYGDGQHDQGNTEFISLITMDNDNGDYHCSYCPPNWLKIKSTELERILSQL